MKIYLIFLAAVHSVVAIDLCLFGLCNNSGNNNNNNNGRGFPATGGGGNQHHQNPEWVSYGDKEYYFAIDQRAMNWWEADRFVSIDYTATLIIPASTLYLYFVTAINRYCERKGGYLAEPQNHGEHNFLKNHAYKYGGSNWWLGLRLAEDCTCYPSGGRRNSYEATISLTHLLNK